MERRALSGDRPGVSGLSEPGLRRRGRCSGGGCLRRGNARSARGYERAEPEQPAESDALGEKLAETETKAEALNHDPVLDDAISKAVLDHYADAVQPGQIHVESHVLLAQDDSSADTITVYLLVLQETYSADGETLTMENGSYVPTAITFSLSTSSGPTPLEYWEPSDGSYSDDIRAKFPAAAADEALNDQAYIDALRSACEEQAQKARTSTQG